jgi:hypothetical protein
MNPFRSLVDLVLELRKQVLHRYATDNPPTQEEAAATDARLREVAADCRVAARRMGCDGGERAVDALVQAAVDALVHAAVELFNAPAQWRDPYSRANHLDTAIPVVTNLADDWEAALRQGVITTGSAGPLNSRSNVRPAKYRTGRPKKTEKDSVAKVVAALSQHHGYGEGMSVMNREPATNRGLADQYDLSPNSLSRFLTNKLGKDGHKRYHIACHDGQIGTLLALWRGELPSHHSVLRPRGDAKEGVEEDTRGD